MDPLSSVHPTPRQHLGPPRIIIGPSESTAQSNRFGLAGSIATWWRSSAAVAGTTAVSENAPRQAGRDSSQLAQTTAQSISEPPAQKHPSHILPKDTVILRTSRLEDNHAWSASDGEAECVEPLTLKSLSMRSPAPLLSASKKILPRPMNQTSPVSGKPDTKSLPLPRERLGVIREDSDIRLNDDVNMGLLTDENLFDHSLERVHGAPSFVTAKQTLHSSIPTFVTAKERLADLEPFRIADKGTYPFNVSGLDRSTSSGFVEVIADDLSPRHRVREARLDEADLAVDELNQTVLEFTDAQRCLGLKDSASLPSLMSQDSYTDPYESKRPLMTTRRTSESRPALDMRKRGIMLVRIETTQGEGATKLYTERRARKRSGLCVGWREYFCVVERRGGLEFRTAHGRTDFEIPLNQDTHLSVYSPLDYTLALTSPSHRPGLHVVHILRAQTLPATVSWYRMLYCRLLPTRPYTPKITTSLISQAPDPPSISALPSDTVGLEDVKVIPGSNTDRAQSNGDIGQSNSPQSKVGIPQALRETSHASTTIMPNSQSKSPASSKFSDRQTRRTRFPRFIDVYAPDLDACVRVPLEHDLMTVWDVRERALKVLEPLDRKAVKSFKWSVCWRRKTRLEWVDERLREWWQCQDAAEIGSNVRKWVEEKVLERTDLVLMPHFLEHTHRLEIRPTSHEGDQVLIDPETNNIIEEPNPIAGYLVRLRHPTKLAYFTGARKYFYSQEHLILYSAPSRSNLAPAGADKQAFLAPFTSIIDGPVVSTVTSTSVTSEARLPPLISSVKDRDNVVKSLEQFGVEDANAEAERAILMAEGTFDITWVEKATILGGVQELFGISNAPMAVGEIADEAEQQSDNEETVFVLRGNDEGEVYLMAQSRAEADAWCLHLLRLSKYWRLRLQDHARCRYISTPDRAEDEYGKSWAEFIDPGWGFADPKIWTCCVPAGCHPTILKSGPLYFKTSRLGIFQQGLCVLVPHHLLIFGPTNRIDPPLKAIIPLKPCYVYTGLGDPDTVDVGDSGSVPTAFEKVESGLPRIFEDGTTSLDDNEDCMFVLWRPKSFATLSSSLSSATVSNSSGLVASLMNRAKRWNSAREEEWEILAEEGDSDDDGTVAARSTEERPEQPPVVPVQERNMVGDGVDLDDEGSTSYFMLGRNTRPKNGFMQLIL